MTTSRTESQLRIAGINPATTIALSNQGANYFTSTRSAESFGNSQSLTCGVRGPSLASEGESTSTNCQNRSTGPAQVVTGVRRSTQLAGDRRNSFVASSRGFATVGASSGLQTCNFVGGERGATRANPQSLADMRTESGTRRLQLRDQGTRYVARAA